MQDKCNRIFLFLAVLVLLLPIGGCRAKAAEVNETQDFLSELTFLGDSITAHMQQRSPLSPKQIWATKERYLNLDSRITYARIVAPDTGNEETIASVAARLQPRYLVITLGVDYGVYYYRDKPQTFRLYYEKLISAIEKASPNTVIVLQSIFPVAQSSAVITNEMIAKANAVIANIAEDRGLCFIDQTAVLSDPNGYLRPEYCYSDDGIHLTAKAYDAILEHLKANETRIKEKQS
ncbi:MAG: hypothetical protein IJY22_00085 [Clostridia bacterium]|nr:hypothetical protein [Clostridia bacterium]